MDSGTEESVRHSQATIKRISNGRLYFASVELTVRSPAQQLAYVVACHGAGFTGQGTIEEVPAEGYDDWKQGALAGLHYALARCGYPSCQITVTTIAGFSTDTNPTMVAAAALQAVWTALKYEPSAEETADIEQLLFESAGYPSNHLPHFPR